MSFDDDINRFLAKLEIIDRELLPAAAAAVHESVVFGSAITGSPGQVVADVDGGNLRSSWQLTFPTPDTAQSSTNVIYAPQNEDGIRRPGGGPYVQRSAIGGRHSVSKTVDGFPRLMAHVAEEISRRKT